MVGHLKLILFSAGILLSLAAFADDASQYQSNAILGGDYAAAEQDLLTKLDANPNDPFALLNLAAIYQKTGREADARAVYERILQQRENPYTVTSTDRVTRVKNVARQGIASLAAE